MSNARAVTQYYNGSVGYQYGSGFMSKIKDINDFVKNNKLITKGDEYIKKIGLSDKANKYTNGLYDKGVAIAKQKGYGKNKKYKKKINV